MPTSPIPRLDTSPFEPEELLIFAIEPEDPINAEENGESSTELELVTDHVTLFVKS